MSDNKINGSLSKLQNLQDEFSLLIKDYEYQYQLYLTNINNPNKTEVNNQKQIAENLNNKLNDLSQQINNEFSSINTEVQSNVQLKKSQKQQLQDIYSKLQTDKKNIENNLLTYDVLNKQYYDNSIFVESTNSQYMFWSIIAIILVYYTILNVNDTFMLFSIVFLLLLMVCLFSFVQSLRMNRNTLVFILTIFILFLILNNFLE